MGKRWSWPWASRPAVQWHCKVKVVEHHVQYDMCLGSCCRVSKRWSHDSRDLANVLPNTKNICSWASKEFWTDIKHTNANMVLCGKPINAKTSRKFMFSAYVASLRYQSVSTGWSFYKVWSGQVLRLIQVKLGNLTRCDGANWRLLLHQSRTPSTPDSAVWTSQLGGEKVARELPGSSLSGDCC